MESLSDDYKWTCQWKLTCWFHIFHFKCSHLIVGHIIIHVNLTIPISRLFSQSQPPFSSGIFQSRQWFKQKVIPFFTTYLITIIISHYSAIIYHFIYIYFNQPFCCFTHKLIYEPWILTIDNYINHYFTVILLWLVPVACHLSPVWQPCSLASSCCSHSRHLGHHGSGGYLWCHQTWLASWEITGKSPN